MIRPFLKTLNVFDLDDTLFRCSAKVKVVNEKGEILRSASNDEVLDPGESFSYMEFTKAKLFAENPVAIDKMVLKLRLMLEDEHANSIIVTARADLDDKNAFLEVFERFGIDVKRLHIYRTGNSPTLAKVAERKSFVIFEQIARHGYKRVRMFDDRRDNLNTFLTLKAAFPSVILEGYLVHDNGDITNVK